MDFILLHSLDESARREERLGFANRFSSYYSSYEYFNNIDFPLAKEIE